MKKLLLLAIFLLGAGMAQAQLKVVESGDVVIGNTSPISGSALTINGAKKLSIKRSVLNASGYIEGIKSEVTRYGSEYAIGVYGSAAKSSTNGNYYTGRCYGVLGIGSGGMPGYTYGVAGVIPTTTMGGAGVYGSACGIIGIDPGDEYAGYFYGDVKALGNLSVTGNITGVLLTPSANSNILLHDYSVSNLRNSNLTNLIGNLQPTTYLYKTNRPLESDDINKYQHNTNEGDSVKICEDEVPLSYIEKQIYIKHHYGLSADQLEEVFPDLVYENEDGTKSINYVEMVPILVQAINELSAKVTALEGNNGAARKVATNVDGIGEDVQVLSLGQNRPNPFGTTTDIEVSVPENVQSAFVYVYDLQGKEVQQVDITGRGKQAVRLNAAELVDGMYLYSLIADGQVVETRRMIVKK